MKLPQDNEWIKKERAWREAERSAATPSDDLQPGLATPLTSREAVAAVWRIESARIVGALGALHRDFAMAEDLAQEALAEALVRGRATAYPAAVAGCSPSAGDGDRRRPGGDPALDERYAALGADLDEGQATSAQHPTTERRTP